MNNFLETVKRFARSIKVGDHFWLSQDDIAIEKDGDIPRFLKFYVTEKHPYVITLEKKSKNGAVHRQSMSYIKLYFTQYNGGE